MQPAQRLFTLAEATRLMPRVRDTVGQMQRAKLELEGLQQQWLALTPAKRANGSAQRALALERELTTASDALRGALTALGELGVEIKDIEMGLVDFPSERDGRVVYLCWKIHEPDIAYWHEFDAGLAGRQPL